MAKKNKKSVNERLDKARKARLRDEMLKANYYQRTTQKTHKSKKLYSRKNKRPPSAQGEDE